jgi:hypothetical protein
VFGCHRDVRPSGVRCVHVCVCVCVGRWSSWPLWSRCDSKDQHDAPLVVVVVLRQGRAWERLHSQIFKVYSATCSRSTWPSSTPHLSPPTPTTPLTARAAGTIIFEKSGSPKNGAKFQNIPIPASEVGRAPIRIIGLVDCYVSPSRHQYSCNCSHTLIIILTQYECYTQSVAIAHSVSCTQNKSKKRAKI